MKKHILLVAGARPNFMKIAPLLKMFRERADIFQITLLHTGQHYDSQLSDVFFEQLQISAPDIFLKTDSGSQAQQTASIMLAFEPELLRVNPDCVLVVGDVNSTLACALVAAKCLIPVVHVEAGLRSGDRTMPEEVNRILTDAISDILFVSEPSGLNHLQLEGVSSEKIFFVGNVMIDALILQMPHIDQSDIQKRLGLVDKKYSVITLHRPANVDKKESLRLFHQILTSILDQIPIVWPLHPRTKKSLQECDLLDEFKGLSNLIITESLGYHDFIKLVKGASFVMTDSGGVQEEATFLNVPCLTLRENTERPITLSSGTNCLVGLDIESINNGIKAALQKPSRSILPDLWDGCAAQRIGDVLQQQMLK